MPRTDATSDRRPAASLRHGLVRVLRRERQRRLVHGLLIILAVGGGAGLLAAWTLAHATTLPAVFRYGLTVTWLAMAAVIALHGLVLPLWRLRRRSRLARRLDAAGAHANLLIAADEALRRPDRWSEAGGVSAILVDRVIARAARVTAGLELGRLMPLRGAASVLVGAALVVGLALLWSVDRPTAARSGLEHLLLPWQGPVARTTIGLYLAQAPDHVVAGEPIVLAARDFSDDQEQAICEMRSGSGLWRRVPTRPELPLPAEGSPGMISHKLWLARLEGVREDFSYRFRRGTMVTEERQVAIWHPPLWTELGARIEPPAYTGLAPQTLALVPSYLELLEESRLVLSGRVNHPVTSARAVTSDGDTLAFVPVGEELRVAMKVSEALRFSLHLQDAHGLSNDAPLVFAVAVIPDQAPVVDLSRPGDDGRLPLAAEVTLTVDALDDFGLSRLDLFVARTSPDGGDPGRAQDMTPDGKPTQAATAVPENAERLTFWRDGELVSEVASGQAVSTRIGALRLTVAEMDAGQPNTTLQQVLTLDAGELDLVPGEALVLYLEAHDNRQPGPAQIGRSEVLRLTLPSAVEILSARYGEESSQRDELDEIRRRSQALGSDLDRLNRELMKNPLPDWARQQELESALERQQVLQNELSRVAEQMQKDMDTLAENHLTSREMLEKMDQVAALLGEIRKDEIAELLEQLREAVARLSPEQVAEAIQEVSRNQQEMVRRLDSALAMLKDMAREQELEGITSLLAQLIRKQQELADLNRQSQEEASAEGNADQEQQTEDKDEAEAEDGDKNEGDEGEGEEGEGDDSEGEQGEGQESEGQEGEGQEGESQDGQPPDSGTDSEEEQDGPSAEELAQRQEALAEELEQLRERLEEALAQLQEERENGDDSSSADQLEQALQQALQNLDEQKTADRMSSAAEHMQQNQSQQASQQQEQALRDLGALYHVLLQSMESMQMAMQQQQVGSLRRLASDLLALSQRQEEIAAQVPDDLLDVRSSGLTRDQHRVLKASRELRAQLTELSKDNPLAIMRLVRKLDDLTEQLGQTVRYLEDGRGRRARSGATRSLADMNRIVIGLLTQAQTSGSSSGGSQMMPSMAQRLQQMAKEQAGMNGLAQQLREMMQRQGGMSQEMRAQMERLSAQQGDLAGRAREVDELEREMGAGERILGDMERLAAEMEWVADELDQGLVSEETLVRQERILSRLLDAHNSARRRNFSRRRESRAAERIYRDQEGVTSREEIDGKDAPMRRRYQPVEKAPLEYRDLVRQYFRRLDILNDKQRSGRTPPSEVRP